MDWITCIDCGKEVRLDNSHCGKICAECGQLVLFRYCAKIKNKNPPLRKLNRSDLLIFNPNFSYKPSYLGESQLKVCDYMKDKKQVTVNELLKHFWENPACGFNSLKSMVRKDILQVVK